jgi:hypothetical protein
LPDTVRNGHEPLAAGSERANARGNAVRDHQITSTALTRNIDVICDL